MDEKRDVLLIKDWMRSTVQCTMQHFVYFGDIATVDLVMHFAAGFSKKKTENAG